MFEKKHTETIFHQLNAAAESGAGGRREGEGRGELEMVLRNTTLGQWVKLGKVLVTRDHHYFFPLPWEGVASHTQG